MSRLRDFAQRPEARFAFVALAAGVYVGCWLALRHGFYNHNPITDLPIYQTYGEAMRAGRLPYRDFAVEYPPAALPAFVAPTYLGSGYAHAFYWLMAACGLGGLFMVALCRPPWRALAFVAISPLLIGALACLRFDLW